MSGQNRVDVEILGEHYKLKGDASPEYMVRLARYVDQTMRKVLRRNPKLSIHKAAVLSAVNIADELLRMMDEETAAAGDDGEGEPEEERENDYEPEDRDRDNQENKPRKKKSKKKK